MNKNNVYKLLRIYGWEEALESGQIITGLDKKDGFIHLSTVVQYAGTWNLFFKDTNSLQLLQLDLDKIDDTKFIYEIPYPNQGEGRLPFLIFTPN